MPSVPTKRGSQLDRHPLHSALARVGEGLSQAIPSGTVSLELLEIDPYPSACKVCAEVLSLGHAYSYGTLEAAACS